MVEIIEYFRESNAIEGIQNEEAVDDTIEGWEYLREKDQLSHSRIQNAHEYILQNRQPKIAGEYRSIQVSIGGRVATPPSEVKPEMDDLLAWSPTDPLEALKWHVAFEQIHPFADGNGRIGRLLYLWHCRTLGIEPIMWRAVDRQGYYDLFQTPVDINEQTTA